MGLLINFLSTIPLKIFPSLWIGSREGASRQRVKSRTDESKKLAKGGIDA
jgi:hypothetical protein